MPINRKKIIRYSIFLLMTIALSACAHTDGSMKNRNGQGKEKQQETVSPMIAFYRDGLDHLSAVRRGSCPMYPSCSEYARQAIAKHGPITGWMMAADRLARCGRDEIHLAPKIWVEGRGFCFYDPVEENDFWWAQSSEK